MRRYKAVVTAPITRKYIEKLEEFCDVIEAGWAKTGNLLDENELTEILEDVDFLIVEFEKITESVIRKSKNLKVIGCTRGNPVNIDVKAAAACNIPVVYTPGRNANAAAEFTMGLIISALRHIAQAYYHLKSGKYVGEPAEDIYNFVEKEDVLWGVDGDIPYKRFRGYELAGKTLGLVGLGSIGRRLVKLAKAFDMEVLAYDPYLPEEEAKAMQVELVALNRLLSKSDVISVHCKVTEETRGLIGKAEFELMKPTAYFINTARASIVSQEALIEALQNHRIAGAALDVFWCEPLPSNHPLLAMEHLTLTPHIAGASGDVPGWQSKMIVEDIIHWIHGDKLERAFKV